MTEHVFVSNSYLLSNMFRGSNCYLQVSVTLPGSHYLMRLRAETVTGSTGGWSVLWSWKLGVYTLALFAASLLQVLLPSI